MGNDIAILDFGSEKIAVLVGRRGVNGSIQLLGSGECEYAGFCDGEWLRPEQLSRSVESAIRSAEASGQAVKHLYIGVPAEFSNCIVREISVSFNKRRRIAGSDVEELMEQGDQIDETSGFTLINRQPVYYTLDDGRRIINPEGMSSNRLGGLISYIYAENKFLSYIDSIMQTLGIESAEYVSGVLAEALFLLDDERRDRQAVLIDIGYITSFVSMVRGDGLLSLNSFSLGGGHITGDLTSYFGIPFAEAEALKRKVMLSLVPEPDDVYEIKGKEFEADTVNKIVSSRIAVIAKAVSQCLEKCAYEIPSSVPLYLTGGGISYMRGAKEYLSQLLAREVEIITPALPQMSRPHMSSSFGLLNLMLDAEIPKIKKKGLFSKLFGK